MFARALPSNKSVFRPNSIESTVSASKVGNTRAGAIGLPAAVSQPL
jgi:hypothetical protein